MENPEWFQGTADAVRHALEDLDLTRSEAFDAGPRLGVLLAQQPRGPVDDRDPGPEGREDVRHLGGHEATAEDQHAGRQTSDAVRLMQYVVFGDDQVFGRDIGIGCRATIGIQALALNNCFETWMEVEFR